MEMEVDSVLPEGGVEAAKGECNFVDCYLIPFSQVPYPPLLLIV